MPDLQECASPARLRPPTDARAAGVKKSERERAIVDHLDRGVPVVEMRMRAVVREILPRRMPAPPEEFVAAQVSARLSSVQPATIARPSGNITLKTLNLRPAAEPSGVCNPDDLIRECRNMIRRAATFTPLERPSTGRGLRNRRKSCFVTRLGAQVPDESAARTACPSPEEVGRCGRGR